MKNTMNELSDDWQREIKALRAENARYRRERNDIRHDLEAADARIIELEDELAALKTGTRR